MPILSTDLLRATKNLQNDSQKKDFRHCICPCSCVCLCFVFALKIQHLPQSGEKTLVLKVKIFFSVIQFSKMEISSLKSYPSSIKPSSPSTFFLSSAWLLPAFSSPHAVAFWCMDVAITGKGRNHCTKASNSFSSPGIRADQCKSSSSALNTWARGGKKEVAIIAS